MLASSTDILTESSAFEAIGPSDITLTSRISTTVVPSTDDLVDYQPEPGECNPAILGHLALRRRREHIGQRRELCPHACTQTVASYWERAYWIILSRFVRESICDLSAAKALVQSDWANAELALGV